MLKIFQILISPFVGFFTGLFRLTNPMFHKEHPIHIWSVEQGLEKVGFFTKLYFPTHRVVVRRADAEAQQINLRLKGIYKRKLKRDSNLIQYIIIYSTYGLRHSTYVKYLICAYCVDWLTLEIADQHYYQSPLIKAEHYVTTLRPILNQYIEASDLLHKIKTSQAVQEDNQDGGQPSR